MTTTLTNQQLALDLDRKCSVRLTLDEAIALAKIRENGIDENTAKLAIAILINAPLRAKR